MTSLDWSARQAEISGDVLPDSFAERLA